MKDVEHRYQIVNPQFADWLGCAIEDCLGKGEPDFISAEIRHKYEEEDRQVLAARRQFQYETQAPDSAGQVVHTTYLKFPVFEPNGEPLGVGGVVFDISHIRRAEAALRDSEERFRDFAGSASDWFWESDAEFRISYLSERFSQVSGIPVEQVLGSTRWDLAEVDLDKSLLWESHAETLKGGQAFRNFRYTVTAGDGKERHFSTSGVPIHDDGGKVVGFRGSARDITARMDIEKELTIRNRAVESAENAILIADARADDCPVIYVNPAFETVTGYSRDEALGRNCRFLQGRDNDQPEIEIMRAAVKAGEPCTVVLRNYRKNGSLFWNDVHLSPVKDTQGTITHFIGVLDDITDFKDAQERALAANRAKSEFLSSMSHELRTPLNAILGFSQLLLSDGTPGLNDKQNRGVNQILKSGHHLLGLISEILDLSKIEAGAVTIDPQSVKLTGAIQQALGLTLKMIEDAGLRFEDRTLGKALPSILVDPTRFSQVLLNLLSNAIKYNRPKGVVAIDVEEILPTGMVKILISDTGPGVAPEDMGQLFEPFNRLGAEMTDIEGTGIGLAISKRLAELMGGRIEVASDVGVGTTFWIEFLIETLGKDLAPTPAQLPSHSFHARTTGGPSEPVVPESTGIKVLYVEDNPVNMDLVVLAFERHRDLKLLTATNAMRGLEIARTQRPDVILMDIRLPEMNGIEALEVLRGMKQTRKTPAIAVTAHAMEAQREAAMEAGFDAYLTKPLDIPELLKAVRQFARVSELL